MNNSSLSDLSAVRLASGVEPQQKWPTSNESDNDGSKPGDTTSTGGPKLIELSPTQGGEGTIITVVVQVLPPQMPAKLAFNSLMINTKQMQAQGITSLVATVPPFQQTHSATPNVPVSICFLDKDMVTKTWLVADFSYNNSEKDEKKTTATTSPFNVNNNSNMNDTFQPKDNNDFLNSSAAAYQNFYSSAAVNSPYGFGAQIPSYQQYSYQQQQPSAQQHRAIFQDKYNQQGLSTQQHQQYDGYSNPALNLFPTTTASTGGFTSMLTSGLDQTATTTAPSTIMSPLTSSYVPQPQPQPTRPRQQHTNRENNSGGAVYGFKSATHTPTTSVANYQPYPGLVSRANLDIMGDLDAMAKSWTTDEWDHRRRIVQFWHEQHGNKITCSFQPVPQGERASNSSNIVVSCIYWIERNDFFITSVDCIYLLECLMDIRFSVEEKNRIRRNLEGFRPLTVSKCKAESADFFKLIMSFPNPKPRNIEKDVKVFPWKTLPYALKKIVTKYTASSYNNANNNSNQQKVNTTNQQINNSNSNKSNNNAVPVTSSPTSANTNTKDIRSTADPTFYQPERSPLPNNYQQQQSSYTHDVYEQQGYYNQQQQQPNQPNHTVNNPNSNNESTSSNSNVGSLNIVVNNNTAITTETTTNTPPNAANNTNTVSIKNGNDETTVASPSLSEQKSIHSN